LPEKVRIEQGCLDRSICRVLVLCKLLLNGDRVSRSYEMHHALFKSC
jgi:hypothetical protein